MGRYPKPYTKPAVAFPGVEGLVSITKPTTGRREHPIIRRSLRPPRRKARLAFVYRVARAARRMKDVLFTDPPREGRLRRGRRSASCSSRSRRCGARLFAVGDAAAMQAIRELASRRAPGTGITQPRSAGGAVPDAGHRRRSQLPGAELAQTEAPRGVVGRLLAARSAAATCKLHHRGPCDRRKFAKLCRRRVGRWRSPRFRHALSQLEARNAAEQVGNSRAWRYRSGAS